MSENRLLASVWFQELVGEGGGDVAVRKHSSSLMALALALGLFIGFSQFPECDAATSTKVSVQRGTVLTGKSTKEGMSSPNAKRKVEKTTGKVPKLTEKNRGTSTGSLKQAGVGSKSVVATLRQDPDQPPKMGTFESFDTETCRQRLQEAMQPLKLMQLADECAAPHSEEEYLREVRRIGAGARNAADAQRRAGMSVELFEELIRDSHAYDMVAKAVRGDMVASYDLAQAYKGGKGGREPNFRRMEQWLLFSSELGSGRASWELAEHYNYLGLVSDAARFEKRALDLGFRPPLRLPSRGY